MVNPAFARLVVDVEVLKVVVKVNATSAEIAAKKSRVRGEYSGDIDMALPAERNGHANLPFVKMGDYGLGQLPRDVLHASGDQFSIKERWGGATYLPQEPRDDVAEDDRLVGLVVVGRSRDTSEIPKVALPFIQPGVLTAGVEQDDLGGAFDQPPPIEQDHAFSAHGLYGFA